MNEAEHTALMETIALVTMILDKLEWHDLAYKYFERVSPYLDERRAVGKTEGPSNERP